jgi:hypothetical protein
VVKNGEQVMGNTARVKVVKMGVCESAGPRRRRQRPAARTKSIERFEPVAKSRICIASLR